MEIDVTGMKGDGSTDQVLPVFIKNLVEQLSKTSEYIDDEVFISKGSVLSVYESSNISHTLSSTKNDPHWFESEVLINNRLTNENYHTDIRQVVLNNELDYKFSPGDTISIRPQNDDAIINKFFELQPHLKQYRFAKVLIQDVDQKIIQTLEDILRHEIDLKSVPKRNFFMKIWNFQSIGNQSAIAEDDGQLQTLNSHKQKLFEFGHSSDPYDYIEYVVQPRRTILEILFDFEYIKLPFEYMLQILPKIKERQYSISSSDLSSKNFEITIKVVEYETVLLEKRKGLCTNYIKGLTPGDKIKIKLNHCNLWDKLEEPIMQGAEAIILIGPGVGIAPIKSFCDNDDYSSFNKYVYFGNRNRDMDYIYKSFWENKERSDMIVRTCFSRDGGKESTFRTCCGTTRH